MSNSPIVILSLRRISYAVGSLFNREHTPHTHHPKPHTPSPHKQNQKNAFHRKNQPFIENSVIIQELYCRIVNCKITKLTIPHLLTYFIKLMTKLITKLSVSFKNYLLSGTNQIPYLFTHPAFFKYGLGANKSHVF